MRRIKTLRDKISVLAGYLLGYSIFLIIGSIAVRLFVTSPRIVDFVISYGVTSFAFIVLVVFLGFRVAYTDKNPPANI